MTPGGALHPSVMYRMVKFNIMNLMKDPFWEKLSIERKKELIPILFRRSLKRPIVIASISSNILLIVFLLLIVPDFEYKYLLIVLIAPILTKVSFIPFSKQQLLEFQSIEGLTSKDYELIHLDGIGVEESDDVKIANNEIHPKIRVAASNNGYSVQTRKYYIYYFRHFDDYDSALQFVKENPSNSYE